VPVNFALVVHAHQPIGNFDHVIEDAYKTSYRPFVEELARHSRLHFTIHFSGFLLDWLCQRHPEYIQCLRQLVASKRLEVLGGGYYEPILISIPDRDKLEQIHRLSDFVEDQLGTRPRGIWLTERVWEPELPGSLAAAGVEYAVIDDTHFLMAGLEQEQTYGDYLTEHEGGAVRLFPSNKLLRHLIPFKPVEQSIEFFGKVAKEHRHALLTMGDDLEKFGTWPHTYDHVYKDHWLRDFLDGVDQISDQLRSVTLSEYISQHSPLGIVYLPTASYAEMMQWALPTKAAAVFKRALDDPAVEPYRRFLAGAPWRSFLAKYREANYLHKLALDVSRRLHAVEQRHKTATASLSAPGEAADNGAPQRVFHEAYTHLLAAQCNDAYWHGLFGGLYAPHLRDALYTHLLSADDLIEQLHGPTSFRRIDLNLDGRDEIELRNRWLRAVINACDGGTVEEIDFRPANANIINSLQRRPEVYHEKIRQLTGSAGKQFPTKEMSTVKEAGLEKVLQYDRYGRNCWRVYLFSGAKNFSDFEAGALDEWQELATAEFTITQPGNELPRSGLPAVVLERELSHGHNRFRARKTYRLEETDSAGRLCCDVELGTGYPQDHVNIAVEMVINFLAPSASDRVIISGNQRNQLAWAGEAGGGPLEFIDEWKNIRVRLEAEKADHWWVRPIYTVSQSEGGFERVYQGSSVLAVWRQVLPKFSVVAAVGRARE
jgi:alpha-amylase